MSREARAQMKSQQGWVASGRDFRKLVERMESIFFSRWEKKSARKAGRKEADKGCSRYFVIKPKPQTTRRRSPTPTGETLTKVRDQESGEGQRVRIR